MVVGLKYIISLLEKDGNLYDRDRLTGVYRYAKEKHAGQIRHTGKTQFSHSARVAQTLADWGLDQVSVEAALLHEVPELTTTTIDDIRSVYGDECADIVSGVIKVGKVKLRGSQNAEFLENLRKMFVSMAQDIRVVIIRLADRLHNISTLDAVPLDKQKRIALETLEVYAPLADRLGMGKLKGDLEDLSFPFVYPEEYKWLTAIAKPHFKYSKDNIKNVITKIRLQLAKHGLNARTEHRLKRKYSLFRKLLRPEINRDINKIFDLMAVRIITPDTASCYAVLGIIHQYWKPVPYLGISDFIAQQKPNGYQSIHTKVFDSRGNIVEIQIRSEEMHLHAEYGAAAHFTYSLAKQHGATEKELEKGVVHDVSQKMAWVNQLAQWQQQVSGDSNSLADFKLDALSHHIYVFSPKGDVYDLPEGSTPVDFAFSVHSDLGFFIQSVKINGQHSSLDSVLRSGDVVEIIKTKSPKKPAKDWLRFVKTHRAKVEIKKALQ